MRKKLILLFLVVILVSTLSSFSVKASPDTETLYVDSYTGDLQNWDERKDPSPYLADEDTGYVHEVKSSGATEGYFGFADPSGSGDINSVTLYVECYGEDTNDQIDIFVDCSDGSGWVEEGTITVNQLSYDWETLVLTTRLDSWTDIQNAQIYFYYQGVTGGDDIYVRRAYLYVDYTAAGPPEYDRTASLSFTLTPNVAKLIEATRLATQGISIGMSINKLSEFIRVPTQSFGIGFSTGKLNDYIRTASQTITIGVQGVGQFLGGIRNAALGITVSLQNSYLGEWTRNVSQSITVGAQGVGYILGTYVRNVSLVLSFIVNGRWPGNPGLGLFGKVFGTIPTKMNEIIVPLFFVVGVLVALKMADQIFDTGGTPDITSMLGEISGPTWVLIAVVVMVLIILAGLNI